MNAVVALGLLLQLIDVLTKTISRYSEVIGQAREEGRDLSDAELQVLKDARKKLVAQALLDD